MTKSFKLFLPLLIVVTSGVIFLGDIPRNIIAPVQAQSGWDAFIKGGGKLVQIGKNGKGFNVANRVLQIRKNTKVVWSCFANQYQLVRPGQNVAQGVGHHILEVFKKVNNSETRLAKEMKVPYNGYSKPLTFRNAGTYIVKIDGEEIQTIIIAD
jgi:hypothetical protein